MGAGVACGYHCTAKPVSFGRGQSAVHTAAYNARQQLYQDLEGRSTRNYDRQRDEVQFSGIFAPEGAPDWVHDRQQLWNRAEAAERQKANGQPARNMIVAFPHQLDQQQREWMVKDFAREQFARRGMVADVAMHAPDKHGDQKNHHAHILLTMRRLDGDDFAKTKCREWNSKEQLSAWREDWAEKGAKALARAGYAVEAEQWRHGHKTLPEQRRAALDRGDTDYAARLDREATGHKGPKITGIERSGGQSDRLAALQDIVARNDIRVEMKALDGELTELGRLDAQEQTAAAAKAQSQATIAQAARPEVLPPVASPRTGQEEKRIPGDPGRSGAPGHAGPSPAAGLRPLEKGLQVADRATGTVTKLGDFMLDFLAGSPPPDKKPDMRAFVADPAARKEQQLARLAASRQAQAADKALESMRQDMQAGRNLKSEDIKSLTRQHQDSIRQFGDSAVQQMVDEAQKRSQSYWKGEERERDR